MAFSHKPPLSSFYRSVNSLLSSIRKPNEVVLMKLLYINCVPCFTYASKVVEYNSGTMSNLNVALNDAIRRIFSFNRWESTRALRQQLGYPNICDIFYTRQKSFLAKNAISPNGVIRVDLFRFVQILLGSMIVFLVVQPYIVFDCLSMSCHVLMTNTISSISHDPFSNTCFHRCFK